MFGFIPRLGLAPTCEVRIRAQYRSLGVHVGLPGFQGFDTLWGLLDAFGITPVEYGELFVERTLNGFHIWVSSGS